MYGGGGDPRPLTRDEAHHDVHQGDGNPHSWIIEHDGRYIGGIGLHSFNEADRRARLAIGISDAAKLGKGYGSEAVRLVLEYAFEKLKLHRVDLRVIAYNARAIRSYKKCGFVVEGRERESALVEGEWYDDLIMGTLESEWRAVNGRPETTEPKPYL